MNALESCPPQGDRKRIDFRALGHDIEIAMEVKWAKAAKINIKGDQEKLQAFLKARPQAFALLCVFGRKSHIEDIKLPADIFKEQGPPLYAEFKKTRYGCRIFKLSLVKP